MANNVYDDVNLLSMQDLERLSKKQTDNIKKCYYNALKHLSKAISQKDKVNTAIWTHIANELKRLVKT
ncbi:hypothetical protein [Thermoanaerobacterium thermosaccharolyticum]|uniref:hypothetical protein n=1 Tax=Thermoanaerobacterium thermosaccharolyticum TaxID=1517 RepID=UPI00178635B6|nr:hypothetical protein [Thermoanaerobacterium thermosaccharolyticum]MBE0069816.1 hypothetical protein [Thermoanaerobacterium thermosaccharolyticum]MBE0227520.1 hypothetical protein [Thermoanaerobacterium thermosaccharolyticum]